MPVRPRRSVLYVPGANVKAIAKARGLAADSIIFDLEDSVAPEAKAMARREIAAAIAQGGFGRRELIIRINPLQSPWGSDDMAAAVSAAPDGILLPKVDGPGSIMQAARAMRECHAPDAMRLWAMMETPGAILQAGAIAATSADSSSRLSVLVMGLNDLSKETRARLAPGRAAMLAWLAQTLLAARAHGCDIIDGVYNAIGDADGFLRECEQGRDLGFDGKTLIHPGQVEACNAVFSPSASEIEAARAIVAIFDAPENAGKGVVQLNAKMVELLHRDMALRTLAIADAIGASAAAPA